MQFRRAGPKDLPQSAELRWSSRTEEDGETPHCSSETFAAAFVSFFTEGFT